MPDKKKTKYDSIKQPAKNKQTLAYQQIKQDILNNTYPEGTVMVERKLCDIYHMSRSPIRNALQRLTLEGLLSFVPGKGVVVSSFTTEDILEVYDLIELLQVYAVESCIMKCTPAVLESLQTALAQMKNALEQNDIYQFTRRDQDFHRQIVNDSGNTRLKYLYGQLDSQQMFFISTILEDRFLAERSYQEHSLVLSQIEARDISAAQNALKEHYKNIKQYYIDKLLSRIHI